MIEKLVKMLIHKQVLLGKIKSEDISVYQYGYTLMLERIVNIIITILIAFVTGKWATIILFLFAFIPLRSFAGGWHSNKFWICTLLSNLVILLATIVTEAAIGVNWYIILLTEILFFILIAILSPVESDNKKLTEVECNRYKIIVIFILCIQCFIQIIAGIKGQICFVIPISYSHIVMGISIILAKILNYNKTAN